MWTCSPSKPIRYATILLATLVAVACNADTEEQRQDEVDGLSYVDAGLRQACVGQPFETVLEMSDELAKKGGHEDPLGAVMIEIDGPLVLVGDERYEDGVRVGTYQCTSAPADAFLRASYEDATAVARVECIECEPPGMDTGTGGEGPSTGGSTGPSADPPGDCEGAMTGQQSCEGYDLVDFIDHDVQCDQGLHATLVMAGPVEQDADFLGRLEFTLTVNGTADGGAVYATVFGTSDDTGPFELTSPGPSPLSLGPDDVIEIDADGNVVFRLSDATLDATGATFDTIDVQSNILDDAGGVSLGDSMRNIPWPCQ